MQQHFRGGTGSHNHRFAFQVSEIFDVAAFFRQQAGADNENGVRKGRLFLAFNVVGGGTTFKVEGAVLQQRNAVLGGNRNQLHLQVRFVQLFLHGLNNCVGVIL
ncbi:hypothetical protein D3C73_1367400 [compost metagenome]